MPRFKKLIVVVVTISLNLVLFTQIPPVRADVTACSASVAEDTVTTLSRTYLHFTIINSDNVTYRWINITRPSADYTILASSALEWTAVHDEEVVTLTNGSLVPTDHVNIVVQVDTGADEIPPGDWQVQVSDDPDGLNPYNCTGALSTQISGADTTQPVVSDVALSNLTSNSITISWLTDERTTGKVAYGLDNSYPLQKDSVGFSTSHSVVVTGLSFGSLYYFQVQSTDASGNVGTGDDQTFLTPDAPIASSSTTNTSSADNSSVQKLAVPIENVPPTVVLNPVSGTIFKQTPLFSGAATDNSAIFSVEFSTDSGKNWQNVDTLKNLGSKSVTFSFLPKNLDDGNYNVLVRATDISSNIGVSNIVTIVIDRLPPLTGPALVSVGPEVLNAASDGTLLTLAGLNQRLTFASVGGALEIKVLAQNETSKDSKTFTLKQNSGSGLWGTQLNFADPGNYTLKVNALDGSGNRTLRDLGKMVVLAPGQVLAAATKQPINKATVRVFYLEKTSKIWKLWDGGSFGQANPQTTDRLGNFKFLLPPGEYYVEAKAQGFAPLLSNIFTLNSVSPLTASLSLEPTLKLFGFNLPWPLISFGTVNPNARVATSAGTNSFVGKALPDFNLPLTNGNQLSSLDLLAKPTLLSFINSWAPSGLEQLRVLKLLAASSDINVVPVFTMESSGRVGVFEKLSDLSLNSLVDSDGSLVSKLNLQTLPTTFFVDRKGVIKQVKVGVLSEEEFLSSLEGL